MSKTPTAFALWRQSQAATRKGVSDAALEAEWAKLAPASYKPWLAAAMSCLSFCQAVQVKGSAVAAEGRGAVATPTPYALWLEANREKIEAEVTQEEVFGQVAGRMWKQVDPAEKQKWVQEARDLASSPGPQKAKPPATPYNLWCAANRDRIMELAAKEPKTTGFSLVASKLWGSLSEEDRQPFVEEAARDRAQFKKESRYMGKGPSRDPIAPKLPLTAYMIYARDHRGEVAASVAGGVIEHGKELGRRWQALGEEERKPYFDQASEARVKFEQALAEYKSSDAYKQFQTKVQAEMSKKRPAPKDPDAPKRPTNAYMLFSESCRGELLQSGMSVPEVGKELGRRWKELSEEDRKPWQEKLSSLHTEYEEKLQQYTFSGGAAKRPRQASDSTAPQLEGEEPSQVKMERQTRGKGSGTKKVMVGGE